MSPSLSGSGQILSFLSGCVLSSEKWRWGSAEECCQGELRSYKWKCFINIKPSAHAAYCVLNDSGLVFAMALLCDLEIECHCCSVICKKGGTDKCPVCLLTDSPKHILWNISSESCSVSKGFPGPVCLTNSASSLAPFWPITVHIGKLKALRSTAIKESV